MESPFADVFLPSSLAAFLPGLQTLAGDVESATKAHLACKYLPASFSLQCLIQAP